MPCDVIVRILVT